MDPDVTNIQQPFFNFLLLLTHFDATYTHSHTLSLSLSHTHTLSLLQPLGSLMDV